jgi:hypothetical protein
VGSVSIGQREDGGVPRIRRALPRQIGGTRPEEEWSGANKAKTDKLRHRSLERRARAQGIELRHSDNGYALIDSGRKRIEERDDMSLDEIEKWLGKA